MTKGKIIKSMLDNLEYDLPHKMESVAANQELTNSSAMFVFAGGDVNNAAYHLIKSMKSPFAAGAIASVFVEEAIVERFLATFRPQLPKYDDTILQHPGYKKARESASRLNAKTIEEVTHGPSGAIVVCDFTHEHLAPVASGIVTLHTFRTVKEAIALFGKESLQFENVTIWNENHSCAYELVAALRSSNFFINCHQVSLEPLTKTTANPNGNSVVMDKSYHYETLSTDNGLTKKVVFPIGTIFAN